MCVSCESPAFFITETWEAVGVHTCGHFLSSVSQREMMHWREDRVLWELWQAQDLIGGQKCVQITHRDSKESCSGQKRLCHRAGVWVVWVPLWSLVTRGVWFLSLDRGLPFSPVRVSTAYKEKMKELPLVSLFCSCFLADPLNKSAYKYEGT